MTEGLYALPDGWVWTTIGECLEILDSRRIPVNATLRGKRVAGKTQSQLFPYYGATGQAGWIDDYIFDEEVILLGEDGAPFLSHYAQKAHVVNGKSWVNNHADVLKPISNLTLALYVSHYFNIFDYQGYVTGTTRLKL